MTWDKAKWHFSTRVKSKHWRKLKVHWEALASPHPNRTTPLLYSRSGRDCAQACRRLMFSAPTFDGNPSSRICRPCTWRVTGSRKASAHDWDPSPGTPSAGGVDLILTSHARAYHIIYIYHMSYVHIYIAYSCIFIVTIHIYIYIFKYSYIYTCNTWWILAVATSKLSRCGDTAQCTAEHSCWACKRSSFRVALSIATELASIESCDVWFVFDIWICRFHTFSKRKSWLKFLSSRWWRWNVRRLQRAEKRSLKMSSIAFNGSIYGSV